MTITLPRFTLARRASENRDAQRISRHSLADEVRFAARAEIQARVLALHDERRQMESAATLGAALAKLQVRGWKRMLLRLSITDPSFLERRAQLSNEQLRRFLAEEAPQMRAQAEEVARAIECGELPPPYVPPSGSTAAPGLVLVEPPDDPPDDTPPPTRWG